VLHTGENLHAEIEQSIGPDAIVRQKCPAHTLGQRWELWLDASVGGILS
jgi:hypothetical protein